MNVSTGPGRAERQGFAAEALILLRVAAMPFAILADTVPWRTATLIDRLVALRQSMDAHREAAAATLHVAVPALERGTRRNALRLKRAILAGRTGAYAGLAPGTLLPDIPPPDGLRAWLEAAGEGGAIESMLDSTLDAEMGTQVRPRLYAVWESEAFRRPLALASPTLFERVARLSASDAPPDKRARQAERALFAYLMRAAAKTSPFAGFLVLARLCPAEPGAGWPSADPARAAAETRLAAVAEFALTGGLPAACGRLQHCTFCVDPAAAWTSFGTEAFRPVTGNRRGRVVTGSEAVRLPLDPAPCRALARIRAPVSWGELLDTLAAAGDAAPETTACALAADGLLIAGPSSGTGFCCDAARQNAARLDRMRRLAEKVATAPAARRAALAKRIVRLGSAPLKAALDRGTPVFEAAYLDRPLTADAALLDSALADLRAALRPRLRLSEHFRALRAAFVAIYGEGGVCVDVPGFLRCLPAYLADLPAGSPEDRRTLPGGVTAPVTAMFQLARSPGAGQPLIALNAVHAGAGWLSAFHSAGSGAFPRTLAIDLRAWLATLAGPALPVDLRAGGRWSDLQLHPALAPLAIVPPGEPVRAPHEIGWRDLTLRHIAATGEIGFFCGDRRLAPFYLGAGKPNFGWGPVYALIALASPGYLALPLGAPPRIPDPGHPVYRPRLSSGRVVLRRACWWMHGERLRNVWLARRGAGRLADIGRDCARHGIPRRFFARPWTRSAATRFEVPKPLWVDIRHPFAVGLLEAECGAADVVAMTEALPDGPDGSGHMAEYHVELALQ